VIIPGARDFLDVVRVQFLARIRRNALDKILPRFGIIGQTFQTIREIHQIPVSQLDSIDPEIIINCGIIIGREIPDDVDSDSVLELLEGEAKIPHEERLQQNLADSTLAVVDSPIAEQSQCLGYASNHRME
jgi:hypothetical protein